eukprot:COSAG01_NODE_3633_length_5845_cov_5.382701_2_plen_690_part_00
MQTPLCRHGGPANNVCCHRRSSGACWVLNCHQHRAAENFGVFRATFVMPTSTEYLQVFTAGTPSPAIGAACTYHLSTGMVPETPGVDPLFGSSGLSGGLDGGPWAPVKGKPSATAVALPATRVAPTVATKASKAQPKKRAAPWTAREVYAFFCALASGGRKDNFSHVVSAMRAAGYHRDSLQARNFYFRCVKDFKKCYEEQGRGETITSRTPDELMLQLLAYWHAILAQPEKLDPECSPFTRQIASALKRHLAAELQTSERQQRPENPQGAAAMAGAAPAPDARPTKRSRSSGSSGQKIYTLQLLPADDAVRNTVLSATGKSASLSLTNVKGKKTVTFIIEHFMRRMKRSRESSLVVWAAGNPQLQWSIKSPATVEDIAVAVGVTRNNDGCFLRLTYGWSAPSAHDADSRLGRRMHSLLEEPSMDGFTALGHLHTAPHLDHDDGDHHDKVGARLPPTAAAASSASGTIPPHVARFAGQAAALDELRGTTVVVPSTPVAAMVTRPFAFAAEAHSEAHKADTDPLIRICRSPLRPGGDGFGVVGGALPRSPLVLLSQQPSAPAPPSVGAAVAPCPCPPTTPCPTEGLPIDYGLTGVEDAGTGDDMLSLPDYSFGGSFDCCDFFDLDQSGARALDNVCRAGRRSTYDIAFVGGCWADGAGNRGEAMARLHNLIPDLEARAAAMDREASDILF